MLDALSRYENLGTPDYFWELLTKLKEEGVVWREEDVRSYFSNRVVNGRTIFDGCLPLAQAIGLLSVSPDGIVVISPEISGFMPGHEYVRSRILTSILSVLASDPAFDEVFCSEHISYDIVYHLIQIDISAFPLRFANFRRLLIDFGFLVRHPDPNIRKLIVGSRFKADFDRHILRQVAKRKMGIERLEEMLERNQQHGAKAEEFVLAFEKARLAAHPKAGEVQKISDYDVGAGYDIASYEGLSSTSYDRFIEVKSHGGNSRFYWSKNEISQARLRRDAYFLYLVDRERMGQEGYEPQMIRNPYDTVFQNPEEWVGESQTWLFQPVT